jgi:hypothetical protein
VNLAPQGEIRLFPTERYTTQEYTTNRSAAQFSGLIEASFSREVKNKTESSMILIGSAKYENPATEGANGVLWFLRENEQTKAGVAPSLRAAVLLRRGTLGQNRRFLANVQIKAEVGGSILSCLLPKVLRCKSESPVLFDPLLPPTYRLINTNIDVNELRSINLTAFAEVQSSSVPFSSPGEVESAPTAPMEQVGGSWSEGSTKDQILLNLSKGQYSQISYKFKRFEYLTILNIYNYQHKLVELEKKINEAGERTDGQDAKDLANLLREYRKWHGASWLQKSSC